MRLFCIMKSIKYFLLAYLCLACVGKVMAQNDLEKFVKNFQKTVLKGATYKENTKDLANGYITICLPPQGEKECGMESALYSIAMWKTAQGEKIFGSFKYACGGMGCWGQTAESLVFYNEEMQNITAKVCDITKIQKLAETIELKNEHTESVDANQRNVYAEIPQKGTTIRFKTGLVGIVSKDFAELQFDKKSGTFKLVTL